MSAKRWSAAGCRTPLSSSSRRRSIWPRRRRALRPRDFARGSQRFAARPASPGTPVAPQNSVKLGSAAAVTFCIAAVPLWGQEEDWSDLFSEVLDVRVVNVEVVVTDRTRQPYPRSRRLGLRTAGRSGADTDQLLHGSRRRRGARLVRRRCRESAVGGDERTGGHELPHLHRRPARGPAAPRSGAEPAGAGSRSAESGGSRRGRRLRWQGRLPADRLDELPPGNQRGPGAGAAARSRWPRQAARLGSPGESGAESRDGRYRNGTGSCRRPRPQGGASPGRGLERAGPRADDHGGRSTLGRHGEPVQPPGSRCESGRLQPVPDRSPRIQGHSRLFVGPTLVGLAPDHLLNRRLALQAAPSQR